MQLNTASSINHYADDTKLLNFIHSIKKMNKQVVMI